MIKLLVAGLLSISVLSGCSINEYFSLPKKFDICEIGIGKLNLTDDFSDDMVYIRVGWCFSSTLENNNEND